MAKKTVGSLQKKGVKVFTKAVKMVKTESGNYSFKSEIVPKNSLTLSFGSISLLKE
jgi:hypothetical protein